MKWRVRVQPLSWFNVWQQVPASVLITVPIFTTTKHYQPRPQVLATNCRRQFSEDFRWLDLAIWGDSSSLKVYYHFPHGLFHLTWVTNAKLKNIPNQRDNQLSLRHQGKLLCHVWLGERRPVQQVRVISLSSAVIGPESPFGWITEIPPIIGNNTIVHGTAISNIGSPHVLTMPLGEKRESK